MAGGNRGPDAATVSRAHAVQELRRGAAGYLAASARGICCTAACRQSGAAAPLPRSGWERGRRRRSQSPLRLPFGRDQMRLKLSSPSSSNRLA